MIDMLNNNASWNSKEFQEELKELQQKEAKFVRPDEVRLSERNKQIFQLFSSAIEENDQKNLDISITGDLYVNKLIDQFQQLTTLEKDKVRNIINELCDEELKAQAVKMQR